MDPRRVTELSSHYLGQYLQRITFCTGLLTEDEIWWRPRAGSNAVGNLLLHLAGNLSMWVLSGLGGQAFVRNRTAEFTADRTANKAEMLARLTDVVARCREVVAGLDAAALAAPRSIQGYDTDGFGALYHAVEHMSYHTGQILLITKQLAGDRTEIEFYPQHRGE